MSIEEQIEQLRGEIAEHEQRLRDIDAAADSRSLDDTEQTSWDETLAVVRTKQGQLGKLIERRDEMIRLSQAGSFESGDGARGTPEFMQRVQPFDGTDVRTLNTQQAQDRAQKALEDRATTAHLETRQLDHLSGLLRSRSRNTDGAAIARRMLLTEHPAYRSAFMKVVSNPQPVLTADEARAMEAFNEWRAMSIGTDSAGGFGVPVVIDPTIILTAQGHPNPFMQISRVETITTDAWRGVTSAGVTWSFDDEATEVSDDSPTLAQPVVTAHKAQGFIPYSIEVGMDYPGFAQEMSTLLSEGYSELLVQKLTTGAGDGSNEPFGIVTALDANTNVEVSVASSDSLETGDIYGLWDALPIRYRGSASWMSSVSVQNEVRQLGTNDGHAFTVNMLQEELPRLFGHAYYQNDYMDDFGATDPSNLLIVGDFSNYLVAQRAGMSVELVPHLFATGNNFPSGQRGWYAWARVGADSINDLGFRMLQDQT